MRILISCLNARRFNIVHNGLVHIRCRDGRPSLKARSCYAEDRNLLQHRHFEIAVPWSSEAKDINMRVDERVPYHHLFKLPVLDGQM